MQISRAPAVILSRVLEELDRFEFGPGSSRAFGAWLYAWKYRWLLGAPIRVLVAFDYSHCLVVRDVDAPPPSAYALLDLQLTLLDESGAPL